MPPGELPWKKPCCEVFCGEAIEKEKKKLSVIDSEQQNKKFERIERMKMKFDIKSVTGNKYGRETHPPLSDKSGKLKQYTRHMPGHYES